MQSLPRAFRAIVFFAAIFSSLFGVQSSAATVQNNFGKKTSRQFNQNKILPTNVLWQKQTQNRVQIKSDSARLPERFETYRLNQIELDVRLAAAPLEFSEAAKQKHVTLELPTPDGVLNSFRIVESPILSQELQAKYPDWKTYQGYGIDEPWASVRIDRTPSGFHAQILSPNGTFLIEPAAENNRQDYLVYLKKHAADNGSSFHCELDEKLNKSEPESFGQNANFAPQFAHGTQLRTYRLAIATSGEYTNYFRQTNESDADAQTRALNEVVTVINRVIGIYRREFSVSFTLVSGTNLIYPNPANDPYQNTSSDLAANRTNINNVIGTPNFDVGHLFITGSGGVANLGVVCNNSLKASGLSGQPVPVGDPYAVDYVAHEMGHQFAGNHTFNASGNCGSRPAATAYEPGSAVSIMGYAGICSSFSNIQRNSIDSFHIVNLTETINFITTGTGSTCGSLSGANAVPVIAALTNRTIPYKTPFALTANATDADGDALTYDWQDYNLGAASSYPNTTDDDDTTLAARPLFRPYSPASSNSRVFPSLPYILNFANEAPLTFTGTSPVGAFCGASPRVCITAEDLPSIARTMNFRVAVRDNRGGIADAGMVVNVVNTGAAFQITLQNSSPAVWQAGTAQMVSWNVAGSDANGINTANVKISLSLDGGLSFPIALAESTANDGAETIVVPNNATAFARLKVEAVGNIFFDINDVDFTISPTTAATADITGRLVSNEGTSLRFVAVNLTNTATGEVFTTRTNARGFYRFNQVPANQNYIIAPFRPAYNFSPAQISLSLVGNSENQNFVATPVNQ